MNCPVLVWKPDKRAVLCWSGSRANMLTCLAKTDSDPDIKFQKSDNFAKEGKNKKYLKNIEKSVDK